MQRNLSGMVDEPLFERFTEQADARGVKVKRAVAAAAKLWVELPPEIQARLLNQSLDESAFIGLVRQIVDDRIEAGRKAGEAIAARHPRKQSPKG
ncbi:MAG: hypothetical protein KAT00_07340 [Planctomycetes bacterium]|nr:hypothetical protein [Planctomycetota bacterium]